MSELADFVLNALQQAGAIVEPPAYGLYEVLLPEETARRWGVPAYRRLAFESPQAPDVQDVTVVGYGHPLVETLMAEARAEPACALVYVNDVRLDKRGLLELAQKALAFPNARLSELPHKSETAALCHYVRFNFKAALITDEKREQLVSVVMDAQGGFAVPELVQIERLVRLEESPAFEYLPPAPVRWLSGRQALDRPVLEGLLERATRAAVDELAAPLEALQRLASRHLELDRARLVEYYDGIARDLQQRIERATDPARRASLEDKWAAVQAEREAKLADVEAKYRLRVELALVNLQVIVQPKILLDVCVGNRTVQVERTIVWDPLLRRIEPLLCNVCGRSALRLMLCSEGHLAHDDCLLMERCVDCKRVYCRLCAERMSHCVVCERPVCTHSLNRCTTCGRGTCREHVGLCHAADGEPARLLPPEPKPAPSPPPAAEAVQKPAPAAPPLLGRKKEEKPSARAVREAHPPVRKPPASPVADKIEVYVEPDVPLVNAFVMTKGKKQIAVRSWELTRDGILVTCRCEKWYRCPANGIVLEPADAFHIEAQIEEQIEQLRREYGVPARRVFRYAMLHGAPRPTPRIVLRGEWTRGR